MRLVLDADGTIKLHRAGVLQRVVRTWPCAVSRAVVDEVVTRGKARLYDSAWEIEAILSGAVMVLAVEQHERGEPGLGVPELSVLGLLHWEQEAVVVSDDRRLLSVLAARGVRFLTPADLLGVLASGGSITREAARDALERLRPEIRAAAYWGARQALDRQGGGREDQKE